jgi:hypothetical protein
MSTACCRRSPAEPLGSAGLKNLGAEEGTRTPTPLRVHGPEPCASANSATSAWRSCRTAPRRLHRELFYRRAWQVANPGAGRSCSLPLHNVSGDSSATLDRRTEVEWRGRKTPLFTARDLSHPRWMKTTLRTQPQRLLHRQVDGRGTAHRSRDGIHRHRVRRGGARRRGSARRRCRSCAR